MVNNEFHIIGTAVTGYESIADKGFDSCLLRVEVEKMGSKIGNTFELVVQIYKTNHAIDTTENVLGNLVAVNGYLDSYTTQNGSILLKAVAQNIVVLSKKRFDKVVADSNIEVTE